MEMSISSEMFSLQKMIHITSETQEKLIICNGFSGVFFNFLLIYLIMSDNKSAAEAYRFVLAVLASYNIYYSLVHCVVDMGFLIDEHGFLMWSQRLHIYGYWASYMGVCVYLNAFTMSITLLAVHCLYRYVKISGRWSYLFEKWYCRWALFMLSFIFGILWVLFSHLAMEPTAERDFLSGQELLEKYNTTIRGLGYMGPVYTCPNADGVEVLRWNSLLGAVGITLILFIVYNVICFGCYKLYTFIKTSTVSETTRKLHFQLMRLLLAQAIAPLIFEYTPCVLTVWGGFIGLPLSELSSFIPIFISLYSTADALMVMALFKAYRRHMICILYNLFNVTRIPYLLSGRKYTTKVTTGSTQYRSSR